MQDAIKLSPESPELKELAKKKLTGLIGSIRHKRKIEEEAKAASQTLRPSGPPGLTTNRQAESRQTSRSRVGKENRMAGPYAPLPPYWE